MCKTFMVYIAVWILYEMNQRNETICISKSLEVPTMFFASSVTKITINWF